MKFDINRLSRLAGLPGSDSDSGLLSEAGNRSKHEDPGLDKDDAHGQGKHLNETQADEEVYGDNQPTNSKEGLVNLAFPGIGFR